MASLIDYHRLVREIMYYFLGSERSDEDQGESFDDGLITATIEAGSRVFKVEGMVHPVIPVIVDIIYEKAGEFHLGKGDVIKPYGNQYIQDFDGRYKDVPTFEKFVSQILDEGGSIFITDIGFEPVGQIKIFKDGKEIMAKVSFEFNRDTVAHQDESLRNLTAMVYQVVDYTLLLQGEKSLDQKTLEIDKRLRSLVSRDPTGLIEGYLFD